MTTRQIPFRAGLAVALLAVMPAAAQQAAAPAPPAAQAVRPIVPRSPEIHADKTVTFRLSAPNANEVTLNGSWDGATNIKMTRDASGIWRDFLGQFAQVMFQ